MDVVNGVEALQNDLNKVSASSQSHREMDQILHLAQDCKNIIDELLHPVHETEDREAEQKGTGKQDERGRRKRKREQEKPSDIKEFNEKEENCEDDDGMTEVRLKKAIETRLIKPIDKIETLGNSITYREGLLRFDFRPRLLWIDAICINQKNYDERNSQVQLMGQIYLKAFLLVVWLGIADETSKILFKILAAFSKSQSESSTTLKISKWVAQINDPRDHDFEKGICVAGMQALNRPWLRRVWIRQEFIFGCLDIQGARDRILVACGTSRLRNFIRLTTELLSEWLLEGSEKQAATAILSRSNMGKGWRSAQWLLWTRDAFTKGYATQPTPDETLKWIYFLQLVAQSMSLESTDPRDIIYGNLGLIQSYFDRGRSTAALTSLIIDYTASIEEVYSSFVKEIVLSTRRLDILSLCSRKNSKHMHKSWCPDWSAGLDETFILLPDTIRRGTFKSNYLENLVFDTTAGYLSDASFTTDMNTLIVSGIVWDKILKVSGDILGRDLENVNGEIDQVRTREVCQAIVTEFENETGSPTASGIVDLLFECLATPLLTIDEEHLRWFKNTLSQPEITTQSTYPLIHNARLISRLQSQPSANNTKEKNRISVTEDREQKSQEKTAVAEGNTTGTVKKGFVQEEDKLAIINFYTGVP